MKIVTSNCEKEFVYESISKGRRLDGRTPFEGRDIEIVFGKENGYCIVIQGNTRVLAIVTCEIISPKPARPAEGSLFVNIDLSPMSAPNVKTGRTSDDSLEATRLLERCVRDSKCIDLESLCIVAGLKVWCVRVNIQVLNNDGNYVECASVACISALAHFKRPDVTVIGTDVTVHSIEDHNPIPLTLHHMPVIVNLAIYDEGSTIIVDPLEIEERIAPGKVIIGINAHQEICSWHLSGAMMLSRETVIQCMNMSVKRAQTSTQLIRAALDADKYKKSTNQSTGFVSLMHTSTILSARHFIPQPEVLQEENQEGDIIEAEMMAENERNLDDLGNITGSPIKEKVRKFLKNGSQTALFEGGESKWQMGEEEDYSKSEDEEYIKRENTDDESSMESENKSFIKKEYDEAEIEGSEEQNVAVRRDKVITLSDSENSEEEDKHFLKSHQVDIKDENVASARGWYSKNPFQ